jgi:putative transcriptional regulator
MSDRPATKRTRGARRAMSAALFAELQESVREGGAILRGVREPSRTHEVAAPDPLDIVAVRRRLLLSQGKFAALLGISAATLRNWEQGRRIPKGPARVLLRVAAWYPEAVLSAVSGAALPTAPSARRSG